MVSLTRLILFLSIFAAITLSSNSQYLLPITKHEPTNQFYTSLNIGSATKSPVNLLLDLGTTLTWLNCRKLKSLSSLHLVTCQSSTCKSIPGNGCDGRSCLYKQPNPLGINHVVTGRVVQDRASISTTDGGKFLSHVSVRHFTFSCAGVKALQGLPPPVAGVLALSPGSSSFTNQVTSAFNVGRSFSLCLPSSGTGHFYISALNYFIPPFNSSDSPWTMTELVVNSENSLYIFVSSISVGGNSLPLSPNLLKAQAKLSTVVPYTVLHTDIYNALAQSFTLKAKTMGISKVQAIAPFKDCFDARAAGKNMTGPNVPVIDFWVPDVVTDSKWSFYGANTVVKVTKTVMCLAFLDGGMNPNDLMVVGTHQLQDYMLRFDFDAPVVTTLDISESLLLHNTSCSTWPSQK